MISIPVGLTRKGYEPSLGTFDVHVSDNNISITNSYKIRDRYTMCEALLNICNVGANNQEHITESLNAAMILQIRGIRSIIREWRAHNVLYSLGIARNRARTVDLNLNNPWYVRFSYWLLSLLWYYGKDMKDGLKTVFFYATVEKRMLWFVIYFKTHNTWTL